jgi:hypothetical protein
MRSTRSGYALFTYWYWCLFIVYTRLFFLRRKNMYCRTCYFYSNINNFYLLVISNLLVCTMGQGRIVGIATLYRLDDSGIVSRCGRNFPHPFRPDRGLTLPLIRRVLFHSRGVRRSGRVVKHPGQSSAEVKKRVELYFYSPFVSSWQLKPYILHHALISELYAFLSNQYISVPVSREKRRYNAHI